MILLIKGRVLPLSIHSIFILRSAPASPTHGLQYPALPNKATTQTPAVTEVLQPPSLPNTPMTTLITQAPGGNLSYAGVTQVQHLLPPSPSGKIQTVTLQPAGIPVLSVKQDMARVHLSNPVEMIAKMSSKTPISALQTLQKLPPASTSVVPGSGMLCSNIVCTPVFACYKMDYLKPFLNGKMIAIENVFPQLQHVLPAIWARFSAIWTRFSAIWTRFPAISTSFSAISTRFSAIWTRFFRDLKTFSRQWEHVYRQS